ncbi:glycosyltransferase [Euryarchaeota archaeon]|nr:glycosyltransferase [Euryarchaeota archaeon]
MPKQVLLVRGGALASNTGIGGAHHNLVTSLISGEIAGWSTQEVCEYPLRRRMNPLSRLYKRWFSHPKKVEKKTRGEHGLNLLHITDQEQAHLIPENCSVPTVVTVHDLFHLFPQQIRIGNETIDVGEQNPGWFRRKDLQKLRDGLSRADLLVCDSQATLSACKEHFPKVKSVCVPLGLRVPSFAPVSQESGEVLSPARNFSKKCHLLIVGSHAPRKRLEFLCQVLGGLEKDVKENIHIHHVGNEHCPYGGPSASIHARANNVLNWTSHGGDVSSEALMQMRFASEALLFPSASEGFGYPPLEAMACGTPVLCSNLPSHNELMPDETCLPADDIEAWREAILAVFSNWKNRTKTDEEHTWPKPRTGLIEYATRFDQSRFCNRMAEVYDSL